MKKTELKRIIKEFLSSENLKLEGGIHEFYQEKNLSIGVSFETNEEARSCYIYNLFWEGQYINIAGIGSVKDPIPDSILNELEKTWNEYIKMEK